MTEMSQENLNLDVLQHINDTKCLRRMPVEALQEVAADLRKLIINTVSKNGGHLAPSLGTVELTLALYSVFDPSYDKIIWDVGHQAYSHKILTGRRDQFHTLRTKGGITGFPKRDESPCDAFGVGHASTSISAALGMAAVRDIKHAGYSVVAIIGDGALTGGEAFEGLNSVGDMKKNIIVILNDNEMSIDKNVGAMSEYLSKIRIAPQYARAKKDAEEFVRNIPRIGEQVWKTAGVIKECINKAFTPGALFEELGFDYIGPLDGHDIESLQQAFHQCLQLDGPILIHVRTTKGQGYSPAEEHPEQYHGIGQFDPDNGEITVNADSAPSYTKIFSKTLIEIGKTDEEIMAITAAMPSGTGLKAFGEVYPNRFFDVGIAEEHAVTMAAGMAAAGAKPVVALYSTFAQRAYDQMVHDVCLQNLPVTLCLDRGGLVGADGATHHGVFDYSFLRHIPNMTVMAPKDENELRHMLYTAVNLNAPVSIRYPRGAGRGVTLDEKMEKLPIGKGELIRQLGDDVIILAVGTMVNNALETAELLYNEGICSTVVNMRFIKPLDEMMIDEMAKKGKLLVTLEENSVAGGFGSAVLEYLSAAGWQVPTMCIGIEDKFIEQGTQKELYELCGLMPEQIAEKIKKRIAKNV